MLGLGSEYGLKRCECRCYPRSQSRLWRRQLVEPSPALTRFCMVTQHVRHAMPLAACRYAMNQQISGVIGAPRIHSNHQGVTRVCAWPSVHIGLQPNISLLPVNFNALTRVVNKTMGQVNHCMLVLSLVAN